jgi:acyl carrier protein
MEKYLKQIQTLPKKKRRQLEEKLREWLAASRKRAGAKSLSVFYVTRDPVSSQDLRLFLKDRLPDHMLPSEYVSLDFLPKTIHGKVDRSALQRFQAVPVESELQPPGVFADERERQIGEIWSRILNVRPVNRESNFFQLGGHSLLATQMIMEIEQTIGLEISLGTIFRYPTIAELSAHLAALPAPGAKNGTLRSVVPSTNAPLSNAQRRLWYAAQLGNDGLDYKLVKVIDMEGRLNVAALVQAATEITNRHETLRTCFGYVSGELVQKVGAPGPVSLEYVDLSGQPASAAASICDAIQQEILYRRFDLETGPVMRMTLVWYSPTHARLIVDLHHIAVDGWSVGILVRELNALFRSFSEGRPSDLAPLPMQFREVVAQEKQRLSQAQLAQQLAYWRSQLAGLPELEFRHVGRHLNGASKDGEIQIFLGPDISARVAEACKRMQITQFMFLASVYHVLLQLYSGSFDIAIGTDVANRDSREKMDIIGFFVNHVALRIVATPACTFTQLCERTRACAVEAFANKDLPVEVVLREVHPRPEGNLFNAMFTFHHILPDLSIEGIEARLVDVKPPITKYSLLLLNMEESRNGLRGSIEYSGAVFDKDMVQQIAEDFEVLCNHVTTDIDVPLDVLREATLAARHEREQGRLNEMRADRRRDFSNFLAAGARSSALS